MSTMSLVRRTTTGLSKTSSLSKESSLSKTSSLTKQSSRETKADGEEVKEAKEAKGRSSTQLECDQVYQGIKRWKAHEGAVLIPVVRKSTIPSLKDRAKPRWWKGRKGM